MSKPDCNNLKYGDLATTKYILGRLNESVNTDPTGEMEKYHRPEITKLEEVVKRCQLSSKEGGKSRRKKSKTIRKSRKNKSRRFRKKSSSMYMF